MQKSDLIPDGVVIGQPYALWLVPTDEQAPLLRTHIGSLAERYGTPAFAPHATLCFGTSKEGLVDLSGRVDRFGALFRSVTMQVSGAGCTDNYFTFLFLWLIADGCQAVFQRAAGEFPDAHFSDIGPHLSLMYSDRYKDIDRASIIATMSQTFPSEIVFDRIHMVTPKHGDWQEVQNWEVRHTTRLSG